MKGRKWLVALLVVGIIVGVALLVTHHGGGGGGGPVVASNAVCPANTSPSTDAAFPGTTWCRMDDNHYTELYTMESASTPGQGFDYPTAAAAISGCGSTTGCVGIGLSAGASMVIYDPSGNGTPAGMTTTAGTYQLIANYSDDDADTWVQSGDATGQADPVYFLKQEP